VKGIILAGGSGTRLYPLTLAMSKQLMPVYDKPMIYYPLSTLLLGGIRDILIISTPRDLPAMRAVLGDGSRWGIKLSFAEQSKPEGLAQALIIAEAFSAGEPVTLILGDNIFHGVGFQPQLARAMRDNVGATIFAYHVTDPERYGVVTFDGEGRALSIVEKPREPLSPWAVIGLYIYNDKAAQFAKELQPSARGELEITDLNNRYLRDENLKVVRFGRGFAWFDTGTPDSLHDAASYVAMLERRQDLKIACPEEIAYRQGYITKQHVEDLANGLYGKSAYGTYLMRMLAGS